MSDLYIPQLYVPNQKPMLGAIPVHHDSGLVGNWIMNENGGSTVADSSGNGKTGTFVGDTHFVPGKFGSCLSFDGIGDYVDVGDKDGLNIRTGNFSASVWIKNTGLNPAGTILSKLFFDSVYNFGWSLSLNNAVLGGATQAGYIDFFMAYDESSLDYSFDASLDDGNWHHIAFTLERDSSTGLKLFKDGVQIGVSQDVTGVSGDIDNHESFTIGALDSGAFGLLGYFNGSIDDVMIFNRTLSASEIKELYTNPFALYQPEPIWSISGAAPVTSTGQVIMINMF